MEDHNVQLDRKTVRKEGDIIRIIIGTRSQHRGLILANLWMFVILKCRLKWHAGAGKVQRLGGVRLEFQCSSFETCREWKWLFKNATFHSDKETTLQIWYESTTAFREVDLKCLMYFTHRVTLTIRISYFKKLKSNKNFLTCFNYKPVWGGVLQSNRLRFEFII